MSAREGLLLLGVAASLAACGAMPTDSVDAGRVATTDGSLDAVIDAVVTLDAGACADDPAFTISGPTVVTLANLETDLLRLEVVSLGASGRACIVRGPPAAESIVSFTGPGDYELRFTAAGYVPMTFRLNGTTGPPRGPFVMVRGTELAAAPHAPDTVQPDSVPHWGVRPGTHDLFFGVGDVWRIARRAGDVITVQAIDVVSPAIDLRTYQTIRFTPDGEIAFLASAPPDSYAFTCSAVRASTGEVLARGLARSLCTDGALYAASAPFGLASEYLTSESFLFTWDAAGYREVQRFASGEGIGGSLDASGTHTARQALTGVWYIRDFTTGAEVTPNLAPLTPGLGRQMLGADGTHLIHVVGADGGRVESRVCAAPGCDIWIEPVAAAARRIATGVLAYTASSRVPVIAYVVLGAGGAAELRRYDVVTDTHSTIATAAFDAGQTFGLDDTIVVRGAAGLQLVEISAGVVRLTIPGAYELDRDPTVDGGYGTSPLLGRACWEPGCEVIVIDLRAFTVATAHDHPFFDGTRAWVADATGYAAAGPASDPTSRWPYFAGPPTDLLPGADIEPIASTPEGAFLPCIPFLWQLRWICAH